MGRFAYQRCLLLIPLIFLLLPLPVRALSEDELLAQYIQQLDAPDKTLHDAAVTALLRYDDPRATAALKAHHKVWQDINLKAITGFDTLLPLCRDANPDIRKMALDRLRDLYDNTSGEGTWHGIPDPRVTEAITVAAHDRDSGFYALQLPRTLGWAPPDHWAALLDDLSANPARTLQSEALDLMAETHHPHLVPRLREHLADKDNNVRFGAIILLAPITPAQVIPLVKPLMHDADAEKRAEAAVILGDMNNRRAVPLLLTLLKDQDTYVVFRAILSLLVFGDSATSVPIVNAATRMPEERLEDTLSALIHYSHSTSMRDALVRAFHTNRSTEVRCAILKALGELHDTSLTRFYGAAARDHNREVCICALINLESNDPRTYPILHKAAESPDPQVRAVAVRELAYNLDPRVPGILLAHLHDGDANTRKAAAEGLAVFDKDPRVTDALAQALGDPATSLQAAISLVRLHDRRRIPRLLAEIADPKWQVHIGVSSLEAPDQNVLMGLMDLLADTPDPRTEPALLKFVKDDNIFVETGWHALSSVARLKNPTTVPALIALAQDNDFDLTDAAIAALAETDDATAQQVLLTLTKNSDADFTREVVNDLVKFSAVDAQAVPLLLQYLDYDKSRKEITVPGLVHCGAAGAEAARILLTDPSPWVRVAGAEVLAQVPTPHAEEALLVATEDHDLRTRLAVISALAALKTDRARTAIRARMDDPDPAVRAAAAKAAGQLGDADAVPRLRAMLSEPGDTPQCAAAAALTQLGDPQGAPLLRRYAASHDPTRFMTAIRAMGDVTTGTFTDDLLTALHEGGMYGTRIAIAGLTHCHDPRVITALFTALIQHHSDEWEYQTALKTLTGKDFGTDGFLWKRWWATQPK